MLYYHLYNIYYIPIDNVNLRKYDFYLLNETPYIDPSIKNYGFFQELLNNEEIDDIKEKNYDAKQEMTSLDIDDYDKDDPDSDGISEALDIDNSDYY